MKSSVLQLKSQHNSLSLHSIFLKKTLCAAVAAAFVSPAWALDVVVTTTRDAPNMVQGVNQVDSGSLRAAITRINASIDEQNTITFAPGVTGTISLDIGEMEIRKNVKIIGPGSGALTIDAWEQSRILNITGGKVEISGIAFTRGVSGLEGTGGSALGGAILNNVSDGLYLNDTVFTYNKSDACGAVISKNARIENSRFLNNEATGWGEIQHFEPFTVLSATGGALCIVNDSNDPIYQVIDSVFENNTARSAGGAITGSGTFIRIMAQQNNGVAGGALYVSDSHIIDSRFISNEVFFRWATVTKGGGAIHGSNLYISGSEFTGNKSAKEYSISFANVITKGGALLLEGKNAVVNSTFTGNRAEDGAAVYAEVHSFNDASLQMEGLTITKNFSLLQPEDAQNFPSGKLDVAAVKIVNSEETDLAKINNSIIVDNTSSCSAPAYDAVLTYGSPYDSDYTSASPEGCQQPGPHTRYADVSVVEGYSGNSVSIRNTYNEIGKLGYPGNSVSPCPSRNWALGPLADNGGPTQTRALIKFYPPLPACEIVGAGDPIPGLDAATDQRGVARGALPPAGNRNIGAYQVLSSGFNNTHADVTKRAENGVTLTTINGQVASNPQDIGKTAAVFVFTNIAGTDNWLLLNPSTGWHPWVDCASTSFPYTFGAMPATTDIALFYNADLSAFSGWPVLFGYGVGDSKEAACADMFSSGRYLHVTML